MILLFFVFKLISASTCGYSFYVPYLIRYIWMWLCEVVPPPALRSSPSTMLPCLHHHCTSSSLSFSFTSSTDTIICCPLPQHKHCISPHFQVGPRYTDRPSHGIMKEFNKPPHILALMWILLSLTSSWSLLKNTSYTFSSLSIVCVFKAQQRILGS